MIIGRSLKRPPTGVKGPHSLWVAIGCGPVERFLWFFGGTPTVVLAIALITKGLRAAVAVANVGILLSGLCQEVKRCVYRES